MQQTTAWSSGDGDGDSLDYQDSSPLAQYSNSALPMHDILDHSAYAYGHTPLRPQPHWEEVGTASSMGHHQISFASTESHHHKFSSDEMLAGTTEASFEPDANVYDLPYDPQQAGTGIHHACDTGSLTDHHTYSTFRPGRMTTHGEELSNIFTSPLRPGYDVSSTSHMNQPSDFETQERSRSFEDYQVADGSLTAYDQNYATTAQENAEDLSFPGSHLTSFTDLLSSDPFNPDEYSAQSALRQTPPMLED